MESPVVLDKPPEYTTANERGFPFEEEEGAGAWSELAARHPDIAARLRQRPATATWARKRRPSSQDADDFGENFGGFDRFPFDDIPPEFRDHFPTHWNRRFGRDDPNQPPPQAQHPQQPQHPQHQPPQQAAATQTEQEPQPAPEPQTLPQYGLRNTVDLGQKSPADPSLVDADERGQRSMSAPPEGRVNQPRMSEQQQPRPEPAHPSNVRVIPIVVEGRDEPVINKNVDHGAHFTEPKPHPPHDREQYFEDPYGQEGSAPYVPPANFTRAFGTPYGKFRQGPQPFVHQKVFPQSATAFGRAGSPQRSQSPKHPDEHYVKVPVHHEPGAPRPQPQQKPQQPQPQQRQQQQQQQQPPQQRPQPQQPQQPPQPPQPQKAQTPPPKQTSPADPITTILAIQTDVLNLMTDVENFTGTKNDKGYLFLDEMLTRNLIKLDNIETEGKENIRLARREAIKCIQKCISVLEAKAESNSLKGGAQEAEIKEEGALQEVEMQEAAAEKATENGEVEMTEAPKEEAKEEAPAPAPAAEAPAAPAAADTRPADAPQQNSETKSDQTESKPEQVEVDKTEVDKNSPKKGAKNVKKRDKSKDNKDSTKDSNSVENVDSQGDAGQVASQGDKPMEVDAPSQ